jgi:PAS domain-containing protein
MMPDMATVAMFGAVSLLSAGLAVICTNILVDRRGLRRGPVSGPIFADTPRRYEFREGYLLTAVDGGDAFLPADTDRSAAYGALARALRGLDPAIPARFAALAQKGESFLVTARFGQDMLSVTGRREGDRLIVTIGPTETRDGRLIVDAAALQALRDEAEELRSAVDAARLPIWRQDAAGQVIWANAPYQALCEGLGDPDGRRWPLHSHFDAALSPLPEPGTVRRVRLAPPDAAPPPDPRPPEAAALWFEVAAERRADGGLLASATPVDRLVAAEASLRSFVQTLSKTFAQLPIGLAVFDKARELMLFNPALVTLSMLEPQFLSRRPSLVAFLDALRDRQRMPEPKNYRSWRDEIARLEQGAEAGTFQELWTLPDGHSFRVIGRPHPDGALAFMFEDITSEMSLTRQFRGDLDLYRSALDALPHALAIFSGDGRLVLANAAHAALWGRDPATEPVALSLPEAVRLWQSACAPSGAWEDIRGFADRTVERRPWHDEVRTVSGLRLSLRVTPLSGGAMSVGFQPCDPFSAPQDPPAPLHTVGDTATPFRSRRSSEV